MSIRNFSHTSEDVKRKWKLVRFVSFCCTLVPLLCFGTNGNLDVQPGLDTYTIQFSNVPLSELVKFVSRVTGKNFVYPELDLSAKVTFVSDSPATPQEILSLLVQILKLNKFEITEQENSLLIFPSGSLSTAARVLDHEVSVKDTNASVATKVFKIKHADIKKIKDIISKTLGANSLAEVIEDANCIIVKDVASNIERIEELINSVDREEFDLGVGSYKVQNSTIESITSIGSDVLKPITKGFQFSLVPNPASGELLFVAPKQMLSKIVSILERIDSVSNTHNTEEHTEKAQTAMQSMIDSFQQSIKDKVTNSNYEATQIKDILSATDTKLSDLKYNIVSKTKDAEKLKQSDHEQSDLDKIEDEIRDIENEILAITKEKNDLEDKLMQLTHNIKLGTDTIEHSDKVNIKVADSDLQDDTDIEVFSYKVENQSGNELITTLKKIAKNLLFSNLKDAKLIKALETVELIESSNQIIFCCSQETGKKIIEVIKLVDCPVKQVLVELLLVDASIEKALEFGVDAGYVLNSASNLIQSFGSSTPSNPSITSSVIQSHSDSMPSATLDNKASFTLPGNTSWASPSSAFSAGVIGKLITYNGQIFATLGGLVHALNSDSNVNIMMNPKIVSEENQPAELFVGETTRVKTNVQQSTSSSTVIVSGFELRDVGSKIKVLPKVNNDNSITLEIDQEISENISSPSASDASALVPLSKTTRTKTKVMVPNKGFAVLSGMTHEKITDTKASVPLLGSLPVVSFFFSKKTKSKDKRNMIIFIRAQVIENVDECTKVCELAKKIAQEAKLFPSDLDKTLGLFSPPSV